jgi:hypothetical protein
MGDDGCDGMAINYAVDQQLLRQTPCLFAVRWQRRAVHHPKAAFRQGGQLAQWQDGHSAEPFNFAERLKYRG